MQELLSGWYPGFGEVETIRRMSPGVQDFLADAVAEDPSFLEDYLLPVLEADADFAEEQILSDLGDALYEVELEEALSGLGELGFLGKSLKKKLKKVVKKVKEVHKKVEEKVVPKAIRKAHEKIKEPIKRIHEKGKEVVHRGAERAGQFVKRAAKSGKLQIALAPFTLGVSMLAHPKVVAATKRFMATPYGNLVIGAAGIVLAPLTGGASIAAATALTTANTMYQKKKQAEEAKRLARADAGQLQAEAAQLEEDASKQVDDFYNQNRGWFEQYGIDQAKWNALTFDEKVALIDAAASGRLSVVTPPGGAPATQTTPEGGPAYEAQPPQYGPQYVPGGGAASMPTGGGGGGGESFGPAPGQAPAGQTPSRGLQRAGMFGGDGFLLPLLAAGAVLAIVFGKPVKARRRSRRNPGRRKRHRRVFYRCT